MKVKILKFKKITDDRGDLTFLQKGEGVPFEIKRIFWTYDLKTHSKRGGHAYKTQNEIIIVASGSADIVITNPDGSNEKISLNQAEKGLYLPANTWRHIENFSTNSVLLTISDSEFNPNDYIRDLKDYLINEN